VAVVGHAEYQEDAALIRARTHFSALQQKNNEGIVPRGALAAALQTLAAHKRAALSLPKLSVAGIMIKPATHTQLLMAGLEKRPWVPLGPPDVGGRTRSIVIDRDSPDRIWAGSVSGGIWFKCQTASAQAACPVGGQDFQPVDDFMQNLAISTMVMDPTDRNKIYAGTGEGYPYIVFGAQSVNSDTIEDAKPGDGIFWTRDATSNARGGKWEAIPFTHGNGDFRFVNRLALSSDGRILLAATLTGLFRHDMADSNPNAWPNTLPGQTYTVVFAPNSATDAVAADMDASGRRKVFYSTSGGSTWQEAQGPSDSGQVDWGGRVEFAYATGHPNIVYASVDRNSGEIWRSIDSGKTYSMRKAERLDAKSNQWVPAQHLGGQGYYGNVVWAGDPTNSNLVVVGGIDLWKSLDGGDTLTPISNGACPGSAHADQHVIVPDPRYAASGVGGNRTTFFGNDGGVFKADDLYTAGSDPDHCTGWTPLNDTYEVTQFYGGAVSAFSKQLAVGAQDNGNFVLDTSADSNQWYFAGLDGGGDGGWCAADPKSDFLYGEYIYLNLHRHGKADFTDQTPDFHYISGKYWDDNLGDWKWTNDEHSIPDAIPDSKGNYLNALFIAPFVLDSNNPSRILAGGRSLWQTVDATDPSPRWSQFRPMVGASDGDLISAIAIALHHPEVIWLGYLNGQVYNTTKGSGGAPADGDWNRVNLSLSNPPHRMCTHITISPDNPELVYVTFGGYETDNLWVFDLGSRTWRNLGANLNNPVPIYTLTIHPKNPKWLYVGTEVGVYASEDGGQTWSPSNEGPTNCSVEDLFWDGDTLYATTHGRGLFKIDLSSLTK
jgi:photosystem II stability/assembly factor-like uncharacterized protein